MAASLVKKKVVLLGDGAVGKTSLVRRFVIDKFSDEYIATIGTKVTKKDFRLDGPHGPVALPYVLIGNKVDLVEDRKAAEVKLKEIAKDVPASLCSAKTGESVEAGF